MSSGGFGAWAAYLFPAWRTSRHNKPVWLPANIDDRNYCAVPARSGVSISGEHLVELGACLLQLEDPNSDRCRSRSRSDDSHIRVAKSSPSQPQCQHVHGPGSAWPAPRSACVFVPGQASRIALASSCDAPLIWDRVCRFIHARKPHVQDSAMISEHAVLERIRHGMPCGDNIASTPMGEALRRIWKGTGNKRLSSRGAVGTSQYSTTVPRSYSIV
jgi:hypothetical protein